MRRSVLVLVVAAALALAVEGKIHKHAAHLQPKHNKHSHLKRAALEETGVEDEAEDQDLQGESLAQRRKRRHARQGVPDSASFDIGNVEVNIPSVTVGGMAGVAGGLLTGGSFVDSLGLGAAAALAATNVNTPTKMTTLDHEGPLVGAAVGAAYSGIRSAESIAGTNRGMLPQIAAGALGGLAGRFAFEPEGVMRDALVDQDELHDLMDGDGHAKENGKQKSEDGYEDEDEGEGEGEGANNDGRP